MLSSKYLIVIFGLINQNKSQQFEAFDCDNAEDGKFFKHEVGCYWNFFCRVKITHNWCRIVPKRTSIHLKWNTFWCRKMLGTTLVVSNAQCSSLHSLDTVVTIGKNTISHQKVTISHQIITISHQISLRFRTKKLRFRTKSPRPNYYDFAPNL